MLNQDVTIVKNFNFQPYTADFWSFLVIFLVQWLQLPSIFWNKYFRVLTTNILTNSLYQGVDVEFSNFTYSVVSNSGGATIFFGKKSIRHALIWFTTFINFDFYQKYKFVWVTFVNWANLIYMLKAKKLPATFIWSTMFINFCKLQTHHAYSLHHYSIPQCTGSEKNMKSGHYNVVW